MSCLLASVSTARGESNTPLEQRKKTQDERRSEQDRKHDIDATRFAHSVLVRRIRGVISAVLFWCCRVNPVLSPSECQSF